MVVWVSLFRPFERTSLSEVFVVQLYDVFAIQTGL